MKTTICKHKDMFGCSNPKCPYRGPCNGIAHVGMSEDEIVKLPAADIGDGDCCTYWEEEK